MCKLAAIFGVTDSNRKHVDAFSKVLSKLMTEYDRDGFGAAYHDPMGNQFSERWLSVSDATKRVREPISRDTREALEAFGNALNVTESYESNGNDSVLESYTSVILHARMSTSGKGLHNTHPFTRDDIILMHNGVVRPNHALAVNKVTECDSELILNLYVDSGRCINTAMSGVNGYQAIMLKQYNTSGLPETVVWRDNQATLYASIVTMPDGSKVKVLCTKGEFIVKAAKASKKTKATKPELLLPYVALTFDAYGNVSEVFEIDQPVATSSVMTKTERMALGYDYGSDDIPSYREDSKSTNHKSFGEYVAWEQLKKKVGK